MFIRHLRNWTGMYTQLVYSVAWHGVTWRGVAWRGTSVGTSGNLTEMP